MKTPKRRVSQEVLDVAQEYLNLDFVYQEVAAELTTRFGSYISPKQIDNWIHRGYLVRRRPKVERFDKWLRLNGDWFVAQDFHVPYTDMELVKLLVKMGKKFRCKNLLIPGDFLDQATFSTFYVQHAADFHTELEVARDIFQRLSKWFINIQFTVGNHDQRILKRLEFKLGLKDFHSLINKDIHISSYPYSKIQGKNDTWYITHPKNYSQTPTAVGDRIEHREHCHVGVAHGHAMARRISRSGKHDIFDLGGMFDQELVEYKSLIDTTHPNWNSGFSLIHNDYLYQFPKNRTDWDFWLNLRIKK